MIGYEFHPEAEIDLDTIWEFIAEDNIGAADCLAKGSFEKRPFPGPRFFIAMTSPSPDQFMRALTNVYTFV